VALAIEVEAEPLHLVLLVEAVDADAEFAFEMVIELAPQIVGTAWEGVRVDAVRNRHRVDAVDEVFFEELLLDRRNILDGRSGFLLTYGVGSICALHILSLMVLLTAPRRPHVPPEPPIVLSAGRRASAPQPPGFPPGMKEIETPDPRGLPPDGSNNLLIAMNKPLTPEDRAAIARGWRASGSSQLEYAARHKITDRTLRSWIARYAPARTDCPEHFRRVVRRAIEQFQTMLAGLEAPEAANGAGHSPPTLPKPLPMVTDWTHY
jgi:hypothetical protein